MSEMIAVKGHENLISESTQYVEVDGKLKPRWTKQCPCCHKYYTTFSRRQKFCSDTCCQKKTKKLKNDRKVYDKIKDVERLRARSHSLAVDIVSLLEKMGKREHVCSCCGATENLQVHHKDLNWLNNNPENLMTVCTKCHAKEHSKIQKELDEKGILLEEFYDESFKPLWDVVSDHGKRKSKLY